MIWFAQTCKQQIHPFGSIFNTYIRPHFVNLMICKETLDWQRYAYRFIRMFCRSSPTFSVFLAADDPQSWIILQTIPKLIERFQGIRVKFVVINLGKNAWSTSKSQQIKWAVKDCSLFAGLYGLQPPVPMKLHFLETQRSQSAVIGPSSKSTSCMDITDVEFDEQNLPVDPAVLEKLQEVTRNLLNAVSSTGGTVTNVYADSVVEDMNVQTLCTVDALMTCLGEVWGAPSGEANTENDSNSDNNNSNNNATENAEVLLNPEFAGATLRRRWTAHSNSNIRKNNVGASINEERELLDNQLQLDNNTKLLYALGFYAAGMLEFEVSCHVVCKH